MFWQDRGVTSSQVHTQPQRTNDTPTIRMQPVVAAHEPAWPTAEPLTSTDLMPVAAPTTKFAPVTAPPAHHAQPGIAPEAAAAAPFATAPATAPVQQVPPAQPATAEAATASKQATPPAKPRSRLRRIARRIVGPNLLTKKA